MNSLYNSYVDNNSKVLNIDNINDIYNYSNNSYDVVLFDNIQYIKGSINRDKVLNEIYRILNKDGIYLFKVLVRDKSKYWEDELLRWNNNNQDINLETYGDMYIDNTFIHYYDIKEIKEFIKPNFELLEYIKEDNTMYIVIKKCEE